jgi:hypothetical protein
MVKSVARKMICQLHFVAVESDENNIAVHYYNNIELSIITTFVFFWGFFWGLWSPVIPQESGISLIARRRPETTV